MEREIITTHFCNFNYLVYTCWLYDPKTDTMWQEGCEKYKAQFVKDYFFINWKTPNDCVQLAISKDDISVYRSDNKEPESGFVQIATHPMDRLPYWFKNKKYLTNAEKEAL